MQKSVLWLLLGTLSVLLFAWLLTLVESNIAGRAYAAYGGIYISCSLLWAWLVEGSQQDKWDISGALMCLLGASIMLLAPQG
jgi:small multidrug resistance family-3 protein